MIKFFNLVILIFTANVLWSQHTLFFEIPECPTSKVNEFQNFYETKIYPNPASELLNVELKNFSTSKLEILDLNGRIISVENAKFENSTIKIDISNLEKGFYILQIRDNEKFCRKSFVKI
ncbi:MAG TPA: T9SS type A sorting domain-containing protein [Bacteroidales bacterium]|nr:T9SS type A sorting domain-containing protein [Bacteroidales bacterium]HPL05214.1 T9SS type A sorting domain-containing protein [Bacteroidales bacterium]